MRDPTIYSETPAVASTPTKSNYRDLSKSVNRLEKQVARSEQEVAALEDRIQQRSVQLADPKLYQDFARWNELHQEQDLWKHALEVLTNKWSDLSSQLESMKQQLAGC